MISRKWLQDAKTHVECSGTRISARRAAFTIRELADAMVEAVEALRPFVVGRESDAERERAARVVAMFDMKAQVRSADDD